MSIQLQFYQKPGCINNRKQLGWLREAGIEPEILDLISHRWDASSLRPYFGNKTVADWFNRTAPAVRDGVVVPEQLSEAEALALMVASPILVRRPLICARVDHQPEPLYMSGFDLEALLAWLQLDPQLASQVPDNIETCSKHPGAPACAAPVTGDAE